MDIGGLLQGLGFRASGKIGGVDVSVDTTRAGGQQPANRPPIATPAPVGAVAGISTTMLLLAGAALYFAAKS